MLTYFTQIFVSFLVVMNPLSIIPVFLELTTYETTEVQKRIALKSTVIAGFVLMCFAILGDWLLDKLQIKEAALLVAGGILLLIFAINRVLGVTSSRTPTVDEKLEAHQKRDVSVFPLAVPMIAGPGSLTVVMFQMKQVSADLSLQIISIFCIILILAFNGLVLLHANKIGRFLGVTGTNVITRVFGIILAAMAVQLIMNGIMKYLNQCITTLPLSS